MVAYPRTPNGGNGTDDEGRGAGLSVGRRLAVAGETLLALAGLIWTGQGFGVVRVFRSFMVDRPEWIAIGAATVVVAVTLLWLTLSRRPA